MLGDRLRKGADPNSRQPCLPKDPLVCVSGSVDGSLDTWRPAYLNCRIFSLVDPIASLAPVIVGDTEECACDVR